MDLIHLSNLHPPSPVNRIQKGSTNLIFCESKKEAKRTSLSNAPLLKDLIPEEVVKAICNSNDCKKGVVNFTKPISKKFKPVVPVIARYDQFGLKSAITLEERRVLIDMTL